MILNKQTFYKICAMAGFVTASIATTHILPATAKSDFSALKSQSRSNSIIKTKKRWTNQEPFISNSYTKQEKANKRQTKQTKLIKQTRLTETKTQSSAQLNTPRTSSTSSTWIANASGGLASWYGPGFHGRLTANGEVYDQEALTAAHPSLDFGTQVEVTNLDNGRSVVVTINDRGPYAGGRVIDLSAAAARSLDMIDSGVVEVELNILNQ